MVDNSSNLIPQAHKLTVEEQSQGGKKSVESRKAKKALREALTELLEKDLLQKDGTNITGSEAMAARAFQAALKGDWKAWELVRDTAGQKPVEKVVVSEVDQAIMDEVESMMNDDD